jgi:Holliday junction DNA helicase RuvA
MIAKLTGTLVHKSLEHLVIDVSGVGYQVHVPLSTFYELPEPEEKVSLHTYLSVREDALTLFGFVTLNEKAAFLKLVTINGVGPKLALTILSGISVPDLIMAIETHDVTKLTSIPGIGKKTAERMTLELKDKMTGIAPVKISKVSGVKDEDAKMCDDVISALINLGYKKNVAESALNIVLKSTEEKTLEKLLKNTLNILSKR